RKTIAKLYTDQSPNKDLSVSFSTEARDIHATLEKEKYATIKRKLDRGKNCQDETKCEFHFAMSEELEGGKLYPEGCFIIGNPKSIEWDMRAVLEWEEQPADLDIWARNYDCYRNVEKAYSCDGQKPFEKPGWLSGATTCKRRFFQNEVVRKQEFKACGMRYCQTDGGKTATKVNGEPHCQSNHPGHNQYHKWVLFDTRFASKLSRRWKRRKIRDDVEAQTWKELQWANSAEA
ncbi:Hypothetical protein SCF082_LOCUS50116, partial [Durusdinium trenchii]